MAETFVLGFVGIFALLFFGIVVVTIRFARSTTKDEHQKELQEKKMDIIDKHFITLVRIECSYCRTLHSSNVTACPNCGALTKNKLYPKLLD
jgi:rubrerythrin